MSESDWAYKIVTDLTLPGTAIPPVNVFRETVAAALRKVADDYHRKGLAQGFREAADILDRWRGNMSVTMKTGYVGSIIEELRAQADRIERGETDPIASITKSR